MAKKKMAKNPKLGSGGRFKALKSKLAGKGIRNPGALAASIGRKKFGNKKMSKMATAGKRRVAKHEKVLAKARSSSKY